MRTAFFILALANAMFFAYSWLGLGAEANDDAQIVGRQLNPEKVRLLGSGQSNVSAAKADPAKTDVAKTDVAKAAGACVEWGALLGTDVARATQALEPLALGAKLTLRKQDDVATYWVYIPPLTSRQLATQKANELKSLGVDDYFVISDDPKWRNAISLGVFKTEEAAKARHDVLRAKGVKTATSGARETQVSKIYFQVREINAAAMAKLNELKQGFAGTEVRECASDEKKG
jgi:hypothetical protein